MANSSASQLASSDPLDQVSTTVPEAPETISQNTSTMATQTGPIQDQTSANTQPPQVHPQPTAGAAGVPQHTPLPPQYPPPSVYGHSPPPYGQQPNYPPQSYGSNSYAPSPYGMSSGPYNNSYSMPPYQHQPPPYSSMPPPSYPSQSPYPYDAEPEIEDTLLVSTAKASALLSLGGLLGLTAAATFRWLNGGDFELLPSSHQSSFVQKQRALQQQQEQDSALSHQVEAAMDRVEVHLREQTQLLQRLQQQQSQQKTNDFIHQLQRAQTPDNNASNEQHQVLLDRLTGLQGELLMIRKELGASSSDWEGRLSTVLNDIQQCTVQISSSNESTEDRATAVNTSQMQSPPHAVGSLETSMTDDWASSSDEDQPSLHRALQRLAQEQDTSASSSSRRQGLSMLFLYVNNLATQPRVPRYRKIFKSNESFQKVEQLSGARELFLSVGFVEGSNTNYLEWQPVEAANASGKATANAEDAETRYIELLKSAAAGLQVLKSTQPSSSSFASLDNERNDLTKRAIAAASAIVPIAGTETPPPFAMQNQQRETTTPAVQPPPQTPPVGSIVSPPPTKKHIYPTTTTPTTTPQQNSSSTEFPPLHPMTAFDPTGIIRADAKSSVEEEELESDLGSPIRGEGIAQVSGESWKDQ